MKRKGEWHSAWGSAVEDRRCERGHKQASKSLQGAHSASRQHDVTLTCATFCCLGRRRLVTTNAKSKKNSKISVANKFSGRYNSQWQCCQSLGFYPILDPSMFALDLINDNLDFHLTLALVQKQF